MAKFIFSLGAINKILLYPVAFIIIFALIQIYYAIRKHDGVVPWFLEGFGTSTGEIMSFFLGQAFNYKKITNKKQKRNIKNYFFDFIFIFIFSTTIRFVGLMAYDMFKLKENNLNGEGDVYANLYLNDGMDIILLTLATHFILKYRYYNHHFICLFIIVILCIILDIIHNNFKSVNYISIIIAITHVLAKALKYTYIKYLMEIKFYFCLDVLSVSGACFFTDLFVSLIIFLFVHKANGSNEITFLFYEFYNSYGLWSLFEHFLLGLIAYGLLVYVLEIIIVDKLTPNYAIICYQIARVPQSIITEKTSLGWLISIILIVQIICLLFYLEILECNFCSLNKNTKRNIKKRLEIEQDITPYSKNDTQSRISIKGYDISEMVKKQEAEMTNIYDNDEAKSENNN